MSSPNCCARSPRMQPAASRRSPISRRGTQRRRQAAGAVEIAMPILFFGIVVSSCCCGAQTALPKPIPNIWPSSCARRAAYWPCCWSRVLVFPGRTSVAIPLGLFGLGLFGWLPFCLDGLFQRTAKTPGQASRVRSVSRNGARPRHRRDARHDPGRPPQRRFVGFARRPTLRRAAWPRSTTKAASYWWLILTAGRPAGVRTRSGCGGGERQPAARPGGRMTDEQAAQILGVPVGAKADQISRAHRVLMKKLHPDQGGSTYLAARVNRPRKCCFAAIAEMSQKNLSRGFPSVTDVPFRLPAEPDRACWRDLAENRDAAGESML